MDTKNTPEQARRLDLWVRVINATTDMERAEAVAQIILDVRAEEQAKSGATITALVEALGKFVDSMKSDQREKCDVALGMARAALALVPPAAKEQP